MLAFVLMALGLLGSLATSVWADDKSADENAAQNPIYQSRFGYVTRFAGTGVSVGTRLSLSATTQTVNPQGIRTEMPLGNPFGIEIVGDQVWITTVDDHCLWKTNLSGNHMIRVAGNGQEGSDGDGQDALDASFNWPHEVRSQEDGTLFIADTRNHLVRRIDAVTQIVTTVAGDGRPGFAGDESSGASVRFDQPHSVVLDERGGLLVADTKNHRLRRIDLSTGIVTTIAGTGQREFPDEGQAALNAPLYGPRSLAVDEKSIWVALREGNSIWRIDRTAATLHRIAGTGKKGYSGDQGDPLQATLNGPKGIAVDSDGNLLVVDTENHAVRKIDFATNQITTVLGGTLATQTTTLKRPHGIAAFAAGFLVADSENHRVISWRKAAIDPSTR